MQRGRVAAATAAVLFVGIACGEAPNMVGDAMVDAGEALIDAGRDLVDAGEADAQVLGPMSFTATCEPFVIERITDNATGTVIDQTEHFYAEASVPGLAPEEVVTATAVMCDREVFGTNPVLCAGGNTCDRTPVEAFPCVTANAEIDAGRVRVRCGNRFTNTTRVVGDRWTRVRFIVQ
jgi:hypothetical protein